MPDYQTVRDYIGEKENFNSNDTASMDYERVVDFARYVGICVKRISWDEYKAVTDDLLAYNVRFSTDFLDEKYQQWYLKDERITRTYLSANEYIENKDRDSLEPISIDYIHRFVEYVGNQLKMLSWPEYCNILSPMTLAKEESDIQISTTFLDTIYRRWDRKLRTTEPQESGKDDIPSQESIKYDDILF